MSDFQGNTPKFYGNMKNIPMTINGKNRMPIIEYLVGEGKNDKEISDYIKKEIKEKELASFYINGLFEARFKLKLLEEVFKYVRKEKIKSKMIRDF